MPFDVDAFEPKPDPEPVMRHVIHSPSPNDFSAEASPAALLRKLSLPSEKEEVSLELLIDASPVPITYTNLRGKYLGCNNAFEDFLGVEEEIIVGKTVFDILPNDLAQHFATGNELVVKNGGVHLHEAALPNAEGLLRQILFNKTIFKNSWGEAAGLLTVMVDITEHKQMEQRLKDALEFAEGFIAAIPDLLFEMDRNGRYLQVWARNPELLAQQKEALLGRTVHEVLVPDQADVALEAVREAETTGASYGRCLRLDLPSGETRWFELSVAQKPGSDPSDATFLAMSRDITERKRAENSINKVRAHLESVLQTIPDMVWLKDVDGVYLLCNHGFARLLGTTETNIVGKTDYDLFDAALARFFRERDVEASNAGRVLINEEWVTSSDGRRLLLETRKVPVVDTEGQVTGVLGVARDITELNASRQKIQQMAYYDALTSLPNRELFHERLRDVIADAARRDQIAAMLLIDMDQFKTINDTMGHPFGDELLRQAASRLNAIAGEHDIVARFGGDEFAILLPRIQHPDEVSHFADRILKSFGDQFLLEGQEVFISCSIGIAMHPEDSRDPNDLVKYADSAMYFAKRSGRGNFRFYSKDLTASAEERLKLGSELRRAIERGELEVHYQPKIHLGSGAMIGSEALLRWRHPNLGMVSPAQFIPIAEETGLIIDLGRWVLREACRTAAELNAEGLPAHKVAINLSARQFQCSDLVQTVADVLADTTCLAEWIELEITESLLLDEKNRTPETLAALQAMGITIAIDDFGTGYSALSYLARFPIDTLKIDRSFINSVDKRSKELVKAILSIARCLGQFVVAEGVETMEQALFLAAHGCHSGQGFLYSKPLPKADIIRLSQCPEEPILARA